jgi:hypothetical protein
VVVSAQKAHDRHGCAGMERELVNVDLTVCEGHEEEIKHIKSKGYRNKALQHLFLYVSVFISAKINRERNRSNYKENIKEMPRAKAGKYFSPGLVRKDVV